MLQYFRNNLFFSLHYFKRLEICTFLQIIIIRKFEFLTLMTLDAIDKKDFPYSYSYIDYKIQNIYFIVILAFRH